MFKTQGQIYVFVAFVFFGVATGVWYWLSHIFCPDGKKVVKVICDVFFAMVFSVAFFAFFYFVNGLRLEWYCFLGLGLGVSAYVKILGKPLDFLKFWIYNKLNKTKGDWKCKTKETRKKSNS